MALHTERMERFENAIFKQRKEINDRMIEMFGLLKELTTSRTPEKVLIREEAKFPVTKNVNSLSLSQEEKRIGEAKDEVKEVIDEEESEVETDEEIEEILEEEEEDEDGEYFNSFPTMEELTHHEWLLKNPRLPWVKARIRAGSLNNIKISCMIGHFFKRHAYIDLESPINVMSRRQYNRIMTYGLRSRQKPSNPNKISNFVRRIRSLEIFIGSFAYECNFMILEDTTSIIDRHLEEMAFGRPFINETGLVYDREEGTVMFKQDDEKITFKMPHTMEIFKQTRLRGLSTDFIPPSAYEENFGHERTHYYQSLLIGDEYMQDRGIWLRNAELVRGQGINLRGKLSAKEHGWLINSVREEEDQELEAHYIYMAKIQEAFLETDDDTVPFYDIKPMTEGSDPSVSLSTRVNNTTSVSRPQLKSTEMRNMVLPNTSYAKSKKSEVEEHKDTVMVSSPTTMEVELPSVVEETVEKKKLSPVVNT
ncbi:protein kinase-like domain, concanavalin A-like lectin/glucanase domain protein [Tanacetum coccineum]|uniref:Protein kinase-like domain, concanavalin A-like lectin/glucanase domain protein n=1 Tax=Tanacetum coccineum TaxID=301880 RepID=A0ABQ4Z7J8_9ASTR